jgi:predicted nucleic-acid-binding Zn-ribbon protein
MKSKTTSFKTSDQVEAILQEKGLSKVFNYQDYDYFKKQCKKAFNHAQAIAELFKAKAITQGNHF